jgi:hypothetical protein
MQYPQGQWHTLFTNLNVKLNMNMTNQMKVLQGESTLKVSHFSPKKSDV